MLFLTKYRLKTVPIAEFIKELNVLSNEISLLEYKIIGWKKNDTENNNKIFQVCYFILIIIF